MKTSEYEIVAYRTKGGGKQAYMLALVGSTGWDDGTCVSVSGGGTLVDDTDVDREKDNCRTCLVGGGRVRSSRAGLAANV